jgi:uncharacterized lipoprotein NlpE involved in copper resistance
MKRAHSLLIYSLFILFFWGCQSDDKQEEIVVSDEIFETEIVGDGHHAKNSLDYFDIYSGRLPCADCEGIQTTLELGSGNSYVKKTIYMGKRDQIAKETKGTFSWNPEGSTITLENEAAPNQYWVAENRLYQLDMYGNKIEGEFAEKYVLEKE